MFPTHSPPEPVSRCERTSGSTRTPAGIGRRGRLTVPAPAESRCGLERMVHSRHLRRTRTRGRLVASLGSRQGAARPSCDPHASQRLQKRILGGRAPVGIEHDDIDSFLAVHKESAAHTPGRQSTELSKKGRVTPGNRRPQASAVAVDHGAEEGEGSRDVEVALAKREHRQAARRRHRLAGRRRTCRGRLLHDSCKNPARTTRRELPGPSSCRGWGRGFPLECPSCGGAIRLIALITEAGPIARKS